MIAGQVSALDTRVFEGLPSNKEIGEEVLNWEYPLMTSLQPVAEAGNVLQASIKHGTGKWFSFQDTFSVTDSKGEPFAGGIHMVDHKNIVGSHRMMLKDAEGKALALAVEDKTTLNKHFTIYGREPLAPGDELKVEEEGITFYPWYRISDIDDTHLDHRSVVVWTGKGFKPFLQVCPIPRHTSLLPPHKGACLVRGAKDHAKQYGVVHKTKGEGLSGWEIVVSPGVDPSLMIVLAACMEHLVGWFA